MRAPAAIPITERIALIRPQILRQSAPKMVLITAIGIASGSRTAAQRSRRSRRFRHYLNAPFPRRVRASISRQTGSIKATRRANRLRSTPDALQPVPSRLRFPLRTRPPHRCLQTFRRPNPSLPSNRRQHRPSRVRMAVPTVVPSPRSRRPNRKHGDSEGWSQVSTSRAAADPPAAPASTSRPAAVTRPEPAPRGDVPTRAEPSPVTSVEPRQFRLALAAPPLGNLANAPVSSRGAAGRGDAWLLVFAVLLAGATAFGLSAAGSLTVWVPAVAFGLSARLRSKGFSRRAGTPRSVEGRIVERDQVSRLVEPSCGSRDLSSLSTLKGVTFSSELRIGPPSSL